MLAVSCQKENSSPTQSSGTHLTGLSSQQSATSQHPADSTAQLDGTYEVILILRQQAKPHSCRYNLKSPETNSIRLLLTMITA